MSPEELKAIKAFNKNIEWLKAQSIKPKPEAWISYDEAFKILPRSKQWYQYKRKGMSGVRPSLKYPTDWRKVGSMIEYNAESITRLKMELIRAY